MKTTLTIKTDKKLRDDAKRVATKLGIPLTTVVNAKLREFVRDGHFEVGLTPRPEKVREWDEASRELREHPEQFKHFGSFEELATDLKKTWKKTRTTTR
jgi:antitoxin component of RelBE/YafQ-DinJ toxin-antitoxin module